MMHLSVLRPHSWYQDQRTSSFYCICM